LIGPITTITAKKALSWMENENIPTYHSNCSGIPIISGINEKIYKLYFLDIGLLNYLNGLNFISASKDRPNGYTEILSLVILAKRCRAPQKGTNTL
jgi:hypothetical protein